MEILIPLGTMALVLLGLERNARRARRGFPVATSTFTAHDHRDRDAERVRDELRARTPERA
ncbi:hypothetical protein [Streptacidiphilus fuscans]|uniref:Uncharacterized protein n=1 Tax=Streptacidiphilus fuscans TaxID=2789292 RepID=A0A931B3A7_9ACTN|nr:hypothetical protein [Streptacidiphilus fuscans]MBF9069579.1 hypothetical protein [Streptacidiphilus fuscans]